MTLFMTVGPARGDSSISEAVGSAHVEDLTRSFLDVWKGGEVLVTRFELPAGHVSKKHSHPGEGFLYVIEGSMVFLFADGSEIRAKAGELVTIPMGKIHQARPGSAGTKGIVFRVHPKGEPERKLID